MWIIIYLNFNNSYPGNPGRGFDDGFGGGIGGGTG